MKKKLIKCPLRSQWTVGHNQIWHKDQCMTSASSFLNVDTKLMFSLFFLETCDSLFHCPRISRGHKNILTVQEIGRCFGFSGSKGVIHCGSCVASCHCAHTGKVIITVQSLMRCSQAKCLTIQILVFSFPLRVTIEIQWCFSKKNKVVFLKYISSLFPKGG